ncbi:hypothetical protein Cni_G13688 [Canna indica]|uniref:Amine oxidase domain-containing protein n=1 Tax=Canna indica TaxID=4628 RepID=A0AAQ3QDZ3_9LILI|nr:hypothetical protein Cni_G13688 [Canna indica]
MTVLGFVKVEVAATEVEDRNWGQAELVWNLRLRAKCFGSDIYLHHDKSLMPQNPPAWSAWNFLGTTQHASKASAELNKIQGKRAIWFSGAYQGYGFHEDGLKAGIAAADNVLEADYILLRNPKHMVPSLMEYGVQLRVARFLNNYI